MAIINDENVSTFTGVAAGAQSGTVAINSSDNGEQVTAYVDDGAGGAPADYSLVVERYSPSEDRWMEHSRTSSTGASNPESVTDDAVPSKMRYSITNESSGSADFRISVVSY